MVTSNPSPSHTHPNSSHRSATEGSYIDAATYCELAISPRRLERMDDPAQGVVGLRDVETGERFMVDAKTLVSYGLTTR